MRFLLSIHDVWPGNLPQVIGYLQRLRSLGAIRPALLVVPSYHGAPAMEGNREFRSWLTEESQAGTEILLHGFRHWMPELAEGAGFRGRRSAWGRWVNNRLVGQEAEFCGLSHTGQVKLLEMGLASFRESGIPCAGFVAPTWHGSPSAASLRKRGIPVQETRFFIRDLRSGAERFAPPLAWDLSNGREPRLFGGRIWLRSLLRLPLIKVAIHPGDLESKAALETLESVFASGSESGYAELFGAKAPGPSAAAATA